MKILFDKTSFDSSVWIGLSDKGYMYIQPTLFRLIKQMIFEWESDKHMVG